MVNFLSSWMPEVRHIRDASLTKENQLGLNYVESLLNYIIMDK